VQQVQQFNLSSPNTIQTMGRIVVQQRQRLMNKINYIIMALALLMQPAITEIAVEIGFSDSRLLPSIITSIVWVICLMIVTEFRRRNAEK